MSTETNQLPATALVLLARAGLDLNVFDTETKFAEIQATYETEETRP